MKEVQKERIREIKETVTLYEAPDGTQFTKAEECRKYEESALAVMRAKVKPLMSEPKGAWETLGGYDDNQVVAVTLNPPTSSTDSINTTDTINTIDTISQWLFLESPYLLNDSFKERKEEVLTIIRQAAAANDVLIFGINSEGKYYFINSRQNLIHNLVNLTP